MYKCTNNTPVTQKVINPHPTGIKIGQKWINVDIPIKTPPKNRSKMDNKVRNTHF